jgi:glycosyltransferase involved in cell wall biosynthesis
LKKNKTKYGIIIPTFHEENNIKKLSSKISKDLKNFSYLICFVDGSLNAKTKTEIFRHFKKNFVFIKERKHNNVSSRGYASFLGFKKLKKYNMDYYVDMDADLATDTLDVAKGFKILKKHHVDLLVASRYLKKSEYTGSWNRKLISKFYKLMCTFFISSKIKDYSCGFRFFSNNAIKLLTNKKPRFSSPIQHLENILMILNKELVVEEFPIKFNQSDSNSSIKLPHLFHYLIDFVTCLSIRNPK